MYAHRLNTGESTDMRIWMPPPRDVEERTIPTLYGVMEGKRKFIRTMENRVVQDESEQIMHSLGALIINI